MNWVPISDRIVFESDPGQVPSICRRVCQRVAERYPLSPQEWYFLRLCLDEALTNAILHGNRRDPSRRVVVSYWCTGTKLILSVRDQGSGFCFDECCLKRKARPEREELLDARGRGLAILRSILDEVYWNEAQNELVMITRFPLCPVNTRPTADSVHRTSDRG